MKRTYFGVISLLSVFFTLVAPQIEAFRQEGLGAIAGYSSNAISLFSEGATTGGAAGPTVTSFTPTSGNPGTLVVVLGSEFTGATGVAFGGVPASFSVDSDAQITATVPIGAVTGPVSVTTPDGTGLSSTNFTVTSSPTFTTSDG